MPAPPQPLEHLIRPAGVSSLSSTQSFLRWFPQLSKASHACANNALTSWRSIARHAQARRRATLVWAMSCVGGNGFSFSHRSVAPRLTATSRPGANSAPANDSHNLNNLPGKSQTYTSKRYCAVQVHVLHFSSSRASKNTGFSHS
jgi:hypothetical protein